jgi:hypothetical protein
MSALLFRMPAPRRVEATPSQLRVLDWLALLDGAPPSGCPNCVISTRVLRALMDAGLVVCLALGPARYRLTAMGRLVRRRKHDDGLESDE